MTTIAYDRRTIMLEAWSRTREFLARNPLGNWAPAFARYLREAWTNEKSRLRNVRRAAQLAGMTASELRAQIDRAEYGTRRPNDFYLVELRTALGALKVEEANAAKRNLIRAADICTVTFTKANGERRVMRVEARRVTEHVKGENASRSARIASHTRAFRHPHLLPVWDSEANAIKSVNLTTISRIETAEATHNF